MDQKYPKVLFNIHQASIIFDFMIIFQAKARGALHSLQFQAMEGIKEGERKTLKNSEVIFYSLSLRLRYEEVDEINLFFFEAISACVKFWRFLVGFIGFSFDGKSNENINIDPQEVNIVTFVNDEIVELTLIRSKTHVLHT